MLIPPSKEARLDTLTPGYLLSVLLYGEARGERLEGISAVGVVVRNRLLLSKDEYGIGWRGVMLKPKQFSYMDWLGETCKKMMEEKFDGPAWAKCSWVAEGIISDFIETDLQGSTNYLTLELFNSDKCPSWAKKMTHTYTIGRHIFLKPGDPNIKAT